MGIIVMGGGRLSATAAHFPAGWTNKLKAHKDEMGSDLK